MERIFALYDSDIFYATRFMEYFKKKRDLGFEVVVFTCKKSILEYLQQNSIEILLLGEEIAPEEINCGRIRYIYKLTDKAGDEPDAGYPLILKYQAAQSVMSEILADYRRRENESGILNKSKQMKIISVFSPIPSLEALAFAWSAGSLQSEQKKVLLVLLELFPVELISAVDYSNQSLTEFIYYLKENSDIITKMKTLLGHQGNLSYLAGAANGADILTISKEEVQKWVAELRTNTEYQTIVFYLGYYSEAAVEVLNMSDSVLITGKETLYENKVLRELTQQLEKSGVNLNQDKFRSVLLPEEEGIVHLPISPQELTYTASWSYAKQNLKLF